MFGKIHGVHAEEAFKIIKLEVTRAREMDTKTLLNAAGIPESIGDRDKTLLMRMMDNKKQSKATIRIMKIVGN